jgi:hypothetical protein
MTWQVARELEDPFTHPPNDLPAPQLQHDFNARLLAAWDGCRADPRGMGEPVPPQGSYSARIPIATTAQCPLTAWHCVL